MWKRQANYLVDGIGVTLFWIALDEDVARSKLTPLERTII